VIESNTDESDFGASATESRGAAPGEPSLSSADGFGVPSALERLKAGARAHRELLWILGFVGLAFVVFCALDRRPPNDHDDFYTAALADDVYAYREAGLVGKVQILTRRMVKGPGQFHPPLAQTTLLAALGTFGPSRAMFRLTNLPFLLLLVWGTFLLASEFATRRMALLSAFVVGTLPIVVNYSRKWDVQFHAAALTPIALYLGLRALRTAPKQAWPWWIGFGVLQGLRMFTHPIVVSDVAITYAGIGILLLPVGRRWGFPVRPRIRQLLAAAGITHLLVIWYLGVYGTVIGEPGYSLHHYLPEKVGGGGYMATLWWRKSVFVAQLGLVIDLVREVQWIHLMRGTAFLMLPGILAAPILLLWRGAQTEEERYQRWVGLLVAASVVAQLPIILLATSNKAFLNDWLFLVPSMTVLVMVALGRVGRIEGLGLLERWSLGARAATLYRAHRGRVISAWAAAFLLNGAVMTVWPLAASALGPDPLVTPKAYTGSLLWPYTRSTSGRHFTTHHLVSRSDHTGDRVARKLAAVEGRSELATIGILDLSWDPSHGGQLGCQLGDPLDVTGWEWNYPDSIVMPPLPPLSPWPFVFQGFRNVETVRPEGETLPRYTAVRLWLLPRTTWMNERQRCKISERLPETFMDGATQLVRQRLGGSATVEVLPDPTAWLLANVIEWDLEPSYLGTALLVDRGR